jgi:hypothetical protein
MGYYMRFITDASHPIPLGALNLALKERADSWNLTADSEGGIAADIAFGNDVVGEIEINRSGDGLFDEEIEELQESLANIDDPDSGRVEALLRRATAIYAVRVLFGGRDTEETLSRLDAVWDIMFATMSGFLQADDEGYYDRDGLVLEVP